MSHLERALAIALIAVMALRFAAITMDPPGGIVSHSGALITDEGAYLKAAKLYHTFGTWRGEGDSTLFHVSPLYVVLTTGLGYLPVHLLVSARYASVLCSIASVLVFFRICRYRRSRSEALACCLIVAGSLDNFGFSRVAFAEPLGTLFGLVALWLWVGWRRRWLWAGGSLLFGLLAPLTKANLAYALGAVLLLWLWEAACAFRRRERRAGLVLLGMALCAVVAAVAARLAIEGLAAESAQELRDTMSQQFATPSVAAALANEGRLVLAHSKQAWRIALVGAMLAALIFWFAGRAREPGERGGEGQWRPLAALGLWGALGLVFFGYFGYQVPRWLYFSAYPAAYGAVSCLVWVAPRARRSAVLVVLVLAHLLVQVPSVCRYVGREDKWSHLKAARDIARRVEAGRGGGEVAVIGAFSHTAALYGVKIRPLFCTHLREGDLPRRVLHWRPAYFVGCLRELDILTAACSDIIKDFDLEAEYTIMDNYYTREDPYYRSRNKNLLLLRLRYRDVAPLSSSRKPQHGL